MPRGLWVFSKGLLENLQLFSVVGSGFLSFLCLFGANALADQCSDLKSQYSSTLRAYQSSNFQFPQDCPRASDFFRVKREQIQSLVLMSRASKQACGSQFGGGSPPEMLASLLEHEAVTLVSGCDLIAGAPSGAGEPQPPPAPATPPVSAPPPAQVQTPAPLPPPNAVQSCAAQKTMPVAPGCNADFPQLRSGAACSVADNSVGLTLQVPGSEPTCCVTSCGLSK
jgi:hypothetical protein